MDLSLNQIHIRLLGEIIIDTIPKRGVLLLLELASTNGENYESVSSTDGAH